MHELWSPSRYVRHLLFTYSICSYTPNWAKDTNLFAIDDNQESSIEEVHETQSSNVKNEKDYIEPIVEKNPRLES